MERGARPDQAVAQRDLDWIDEATAFGWAIPEKAGRLCRSWGVRHARAAWIVAVSYLAFNPLKPDWKAMWYAQWRAYAIRRGWC